MLQVKLQDGDQLPGWLRISLLHETGLRAHFMIFFKEVSIHLDITFCR